MRFLAVDDDSGPDDDAQITVNLSAFGRYIIAVSDVGQDNTGDVSITVSTTGVTGSSTPTLDVNGDASVTGTIDNNSDTDFYSFVAPLNALGDLQVMVTPSGSLDSVVVLWDENGNQIQRVDSVGTDVINFSGVVPGDEYRVSIFSDSYASSGGFTLDLDFTTPVIPDDHGNDAGTATLVGSFSTTAGDIEIAGDQDWFSFYVESGANVTMETVLGSNSDTTLTLYDTDGLTQLAFDDDGGAGLASRISFNFAASGQYYAAVAGFGSNTGTYGLALTHADDHGRDAGTATPILGGSTTSGVLEVGGNLDWFRFYADAGASVRLETQLGTLPDSTLTLFDTDGVTQLAFNDDGGAGLASRIDYVFPTTGQYYVQVTEFGVPNGPGTYDLVFTYGDDHGNDSSMATATSVGTINRGQVEVSGDTDWFAFTAIAGVSYDLRTLLGTLSDSTLSLYDTNGLTLLAFNDDYLGLASRVIWTAPANGTYYAAVEAFSSFSQVGSYDLAISLLGDFNGDRAYACSDIDDLIANIASGSGDLRYDLNGDFVVNLADRDAWLAAAGGFNLGPGRSYLLGDANLDGRVDGGDFGIWNANKFTPNPSWCAGDFNADGFIDGGDFGIWNTNKFRSSDQAIRGAVPPVRGAVPPAIGVSRSRPGHDSKEAPPFDRSITDHGSTNLARGAMANRLYPFRAVHCPTRGRNNSQE